MPEVPSEVDMEGGTLRDLLFRLLAGTPVAHELINARTGEMQLEGLFEVRLNDIPHNRLPEGLATQMHDGDTLTLSLILIGGG